MADTKITALAAITTVDPAADVLPIVDISDTSMAASGTTKKITSNQILGAGGTATLASATITGDLTVATNAFAVRLSDKKVFVGTAPISTAYSFYVTRGGTTGSIAQFTDGTAQTLTIDSAAGGLIVGNANNGYVSLTANGIEQYRIAPLGVFTWSDGAGGTRMTLNSTGLGIGASPASYGGTFRTLAVNATDAGILDLMSNSVSQFRIFGNGSENRLGGITNVPLTFHTNNSEKMQISASGNVGIGVTPSAWSAYKALQIGRGSFSSDTSSATAVSTLFGSNFVYDGNWKYIVAAAATFYQQTGGVHYWFNEAGTKAAGATFTPVQAMTLDASGNLLVGKTAAGLTVGVMAFATGVVESTMASSTSAQSTLNVYSTGAAAYRFYVGMNGTINATNTTISAISDARLKENVQDIDVGLGAILALKPRKFDWKEGKGKNIKGDRGFIAQEFETVFPNLIDEWKDAAPEGEAPYKSVRQDLIPVLVKAIQELAAEVNALKKA